MKIKKTGDIFVDYQAVAKEKYHPEGKSGQAATEAS